MFGPHVEKIWAQPKTQSIVAHINTLYDLLASEGLTMGAAGVFLVNPRNGEGLLADSVLDGLSGLTRTKHLRILAHGAYNDFPWTDSRDSDEYKKKVARIGRELLACQRANAQGLVIHLGLTPPDEVVERLPDLLAVTKTSAPDVRLFLETPATTNTKHKYYDTADKLAALFARIRAVVDPELRHVGCCIDTAHLFVSGVNMRSEAVMTEFLRGIDAARFPDAALAFHLNDAKNGLGKGPDTHMPLGEGRIWHDALDSGTSSLNVLVKYIRDRRLTCILERHERDGPDAISHDMAIIESEI